MIRHFLLKIWGIAFLFFLSSCMWRSEEYRHFYTHLQKPHAPWRPMQEEDYFLIILVDARHLDYTHASRFFQSITKHPSDGSKNGDVGHAWIYLQGKRHHQVVAIEGGHSGEIADTPVRYFDGIMNYNDWGYSNPTLAHMQCARYEPNPIKYLWTIRKDGFFQKGSGGHRPTFAAKISLTPQQFECLMQFIDPCHYPYQNYAIMGSQCSSFVSQVAALAGFHLASHVKMNIEPYFYYGQNRIRLWENPFYTEVTFATPDRIEKSLIHAVENEEAEYALDWYLKNIN